VDVVCPACGGLSGTSKDSHTNRALFLDSGGEVQLCPCLNDGPAHIEFLAQLVREHTAAYGNLSDLGTRMCDPESTDYLS
jgi:hypothetical protein